MQGSSRRAFSGFFVLLVAISVLSPKLAAEGFEIEPYFSNYRFKPSQPFSGTIDFSGVPGYGKEVTLHVNLTAHERLDTTQLFQFIVPGLHPVAFSPLDLEWSAPIDSGATKSFAVKFACEWVGGYEIRFSRYINRDWQDMGRLSLIFDEDGEIVCYGSIKDCGAPPIPLHPHRSAGELVVSYPQVPERKGQPSNRDFSASFELLNAPSKGDTTFVEVKLECQRNLYREIQFVAEHSTNLRIVDMPDSWGNSVGVHPDYRYFTDTLSFILLRDGLSYFDFQVVGRHPHAYRGNHITTKFPLYILTSEDDGLLFLGTFDPIKRFSSVKPSLLGTLTGLPDAGSSNYRTKHTLSKPDFRAAADSAVTDSTNTADN